MVGFSKRFMGAELSEASIADMCYVKDDDSKAEASAECTVKWETSVARA